jgi:hypothetical protein
MFEGLIGEARLAFQRGHAQGRALGAAQNGRRHYLVGLVCEEARVGATVLATFEIFAADVRDRLGGHDSGHARTLVTHADRLRAPGDRRPASRGSALRAGRSDSVPATGTAGVDR